LQECCLKRYRSNLKFFKKEKPEFYELIKNNITDCKVSFSKKSEIRFDLNDSSFSVNLSNITTYRKNILNTVSVDMFYLVDTEGEGNNIHGRNFNKLLSFANKFKKEKVPHRGYISCLVLSGFGSGLLVEELVGIFEINCLIIADKLLSSIIPSFYLIDWTRIFKVFKDKGKSLKFIIEDDDIHLSEKIVSSIMDISPILASTVGVVENTEGKGPYSKDVKGDFSKELKKLLSISNNQLGFFDDEITSLKHVNLNVIRNNLPVFENIKEKRDEVLETPVFICGSGPSLDRFIDKLKSGKDKVIVVSCGTALKALLKAGISSDIHFEMERNKITFDLLSTLSKAQLKKINFIGLNVIYPEVFNLFGSGGIILKLPDVSSFLFPSSFLGFKYVNPTVTNMAVSFFSHLGFRHIYFIGLDYGFSDLERHHSGGTVYYDSKSEVKFNAEKLMRVPGNFGKEVYTNSVFFYSKKITEMIIRQFSNASYYNPNFGAKIFGAIPINKIDIESNGKKEKSVSWIFDSFRRLSFEEKSDFLKNLDLMKKMVIEFNKEILDYIDGVDCSQISSVKDIHEISMNVSNKLKILKEKNESAFLLLSGSYYHFLRVINVNSFYVPEKLFPDYLREVLSVFKSFICETSSVIQTVHKERDVLCREK